MKTQNFKNHSRYYPFHHFIITPLTLLYLGWTISHLEFEADFSESFSSLMLALLIFMFPLLARIYALKNQNRIILVEMRQRYFELTGKSFVPEESKLKIGQIVALRFACDEELLKIISEAQAEKLSNKEIKMRIRNWKSDFNRV